MRATGLFLDLYSLSFVNLHVFRRSFPQFLSSIRPAKWRATVHNHFISDSGAHVSFVKRHAIHFRSTSSVVIAMWRKIVHGSHATFHSVTLPHTRTNCIKWNLLLRDHYLGELIHSFCFLAKQEVSEHEAKKLVITTHPLSAKYRQERKGFHFINLYRSQFSLGKPHL